LKFAFWFGGIGEKKEKVVGIVVVKGRGMWWGLRGCLVDFYVGLVMVVIQTWL